MSKNIIPDGSWSDEWEKCKRFKCHVAAARVGTNRRGFCCGIADNAPVKLKNSRIGKDWITLCGIDLDNGIEHTWSLTISEANAIIHCLSQSIDYVFGSRCYLYRMKKLAAGDDL